MEAFIFDKSFDLDNDYSDEISKGRMTGRELHRREHVFFEFYSSSDSSNEETSNTSRSLRNKSNDSTVTKRKSLGQPAKNAISRQFSEGNRRKCRSSVVKVPFGDISEQKERKRSSKVTKSLSMVADDYTVQELGETSEVNSLGKSDGYVSGSDKLTCSERDELGSLSKKTGELSQHTSDTVMEKLQNNNKYRRTKTVGSKTDKIEERPLISFRDSLLLMEYNNQHPQPLNAVKSTQLSSRSNGPSNSIVAPNSIKSKHPRKIERKIKSHENLKKTLIMKRENLQSTPAQLSQSISNSNDTPESPQATKKAKNLPTLPLRTSTSEKQSPPSKSSKPKPLPDLSSLKKKDANDVPPLKSEEETPPPIVKPKPPVPRLPVPQPRSESTITDLASPHKTPTTPHDNKFIKSPRPLPNQPIGDSNPVSTFTPPDGTQKNNTLPVPSPRAANVRRYSAPESPRTPTSPSQVLVSPRPTPPPRPNLITSVTAVRTASRPVPPPKITNSPPRDPQTPSLKILEPTNTTTTTPSTPNNPSATTSTPTTSTSTTTPNHHVSPLPSPKHKPLPLPAQRLSAHSDQPSQQDQPAKAQPPSHKPAPTHPHKQTPTQDTQPHKQEPQRIQTTQNQSHPQTHNKEVPMQPHKQQTPTQVQTPKSQLPKQDPLKGQTPVQPAAQHTPTQAQDKKEVQPTQTTQVQPTAQAHKQEAQRVQTSQKNNSNSPSQVKKN
uniref:Uncharacterized protein n=1 Tax=Arcella intermedia TaxID=1963864 RepID=A0A6B2KYS0_9EUKA